MAKIRAPSSCRHRRAHGLRLEHRGIEQAATPDAGLALEHERAAAPVVRLDEPRANRFELAFAPDQARRIQIGLQHGERFGAVDLGDGR